MMETKTYGYLRVSSDEQDINSQKQGVDAYCKERGWTIDEYITDEGVSGGKDPDKRKLGPLLEKVKKGDRIVASEISRLGRDLYMVMDILHLCMERGCIIHTVKDRFTLGDDIQSKVLAFAFGLSAEIERQMIRQRTQEGLRLKMKKGVLMGRPLGKESSLDVNIYYNRLDEFKQMVKWQMSAKQIVAILGGTTNSVYRAIVRFGLAEDWKFSAEWVKKMDRAAALRRKEEKKPNYKDTPYCIVELDREKTKLLIDADLTIPEIAERMPEYTYEQVYDTIQCDEEYNALYRKKGHIRAMKL